MAILCSFVTRRNGSILKYSNRYCVRQFYSRSNKNNIISPFEVYLITRFSSVEQEW
ncbi:MAG: hypothetical protein ACJA2N_001117 [Salibacteraceae bacterium]|jgi:hypothetical protein